MCQQLVLVIVCAHPKDQWLSETYEFDRRYVVSYQIVDRWTIWTYIDHTFNFIYVWKSTIGHTFALLVNRKKNEIVTMNVYFILNLQWRILKRKAFCANAFLWRKSFIHWLLHMNVVFWHHHYIQRTVFVDDS